MLSGTLLRQNSWENKTRLSGADTSRRTRGTARCNERYCLTRIQSSDSLFAPHHYHSWLLPPCPSTTFHNHHPHQPLPLPCTLLSISLCALHLPPCIPPVLKALYPVPQPLALIPAAYSTSPLPCIMLNSYELGPTLTFPPGSLTSSAATMQQHFERAISEEMSFSNWTKSLSRK